MKITIQQVIYPNPQNEVLGYYKYPDEKRLEVSHDLSSDYELLGIIDALREQLLEKTKAVKLF